MGFVYCTQSAGSWQVVLPRESRNLRGINDTRYLILRGALDEYGACLGQAGDRLMPPIDSMDDGKVAKDLIDHRRGTALMQANRASLLAG